VSEPEPVLSAVVSVIAVVLVFAAIMKLRRPAPLRRALRALGLPVSSWLVPCVAISELSVAAVTLLAPGRVGGSVLAAQLACFALVAQLLRRDARDVGCGCFGEEGSGAPSGAHLTACVLALTVGCVAAITNAASPVRVAQARPILMAAALTVGMVVTAWLYVAARRERAVSYSFAERDGMAGRAPPITTRVSSGRDEPSIESFDDPLARGLVGASASLLERRFSRRSVLLRLALAGSALAVAPLRYLLYPGSALAAIVPSNCTSGACTDGYTAFCCEINRGVNECPAGTYPGGWWICTDYRGRRLCAEQGVRYYVDCNAIPGRPFPGGCRCANETCAQQRVNCNIFRYGQCNPHVSGVTAVVCRMVVCQNPSLIPALKCSSSVSIDDAVCAQDAACLEPRAVQLAGVGGV
jgi:hypothetical protein